MAVEEVSPKLVKHLFDRIESCEKYSSTITTLRDVFTDLKDVVREEIDQFAKKMERESDDINSLKENQRILSERCDKFEKQNNELKTENSRLQIAARDLQEKV